MNVVTFKNVWEMFRIKFIIDKKVSWDDFWALKDISFKIRKGEAVGLIGENGAGKSTVLKLIAGILCPDRGEINVAGKVAGLLELGAGFQSELTGRDNIYLSASLFGLNNDEANNIYEQIVDFAALGKFIHAPVKCYSQGMFVRLAFAIAIHMNPDTLLIDDTLAVGDEFFQKKCIKKVFQLKEQGTTIVFVSHDANMIQRLCNRVIFLKEGRLIKDDASDKVIPLYTQTIGAQKGVGIIKRGCLSVVFNNGRMFLNWQGRLLTSGSGGYALLRIGDMDYSSLQASWEVEVGENGVLVAKGTLYQLGLKQVWRLELTESNEIKWSIEVESDKPGEIRQGYVNIMLRNEYSQWFTPLEKGDFSSPAEDNIERAALLPGRTIRKSIGLVSSQRSKGYVSVAFETLKESSGSDCQIWTDYGLDCRMLQYRQDRLQNISVSQGQSFMLFKGKILLDIPEVKNYLEKLKNESVLYSNEAMLKFTKGQLTLSWNSMLLTKSNTINAFIKIDNGWYCSESAHWQVKRAHQRKLIVRGRWPNIPVVCVWCIEAEEDGAFTWSISLEVKDSIRISEQSLRFEFLEGYEYYFSDYGKGAFPDVFSEYEIDMAKRCIVKGAVGLMSKDNQLPSLSLKAVEGSNVFAKIFNSDLSRRSRQLRIEKVEPEKKNVLPSGIYLCFKVKISVKKERVIPKKDPVKEIRTGGSKFIFKEGKGAIRWQKNELTKNLGVYTSLRSKSQWHDSHSRAIWRIEQEKDNFIKLYGKWLYLPITQLWQIKSENGILNFDLRMTASQPTYIDRIQFNIMFKEKYNYWFSQGNRGVFPVFTDNIDDEWQIIESYPLEEFSGIKSIGINHDKEEHFLPTVKLSLDSSVTKGCLNIVNTDLYYRGRLLQYMRKETKALSGEYVLCQGKIIVEEPVF